MKQNAQKIRDVVTKVADQLKSMNSDEVSMRETPGSWTKKEILGHLIDSTANNHQRIVRACYNAATNFPPYSQIDWVQIQQYNQLEWTELIELWVVYNRHLSNIIERVPEESASSSVNIGLEEPVTLEYVVEDYLRHLQHHLKDVIGFSDNKI
jgi:hypothetical protein